MNLGAGFWYVLLAVVAAGLVIFGLGWHSSASVHDKRAARRQLEAGQRSAAAMPGQISLEIFYQEPFIRDVTPVPLAPGSFYEVHPPTGYVIGHIRVLVPPAETSTDARGFEVRAPMPTYRGWLEGTAWADPWGAQDRIYDPAWDQRRFIGPDTVPMSAALDMAEAAYQLGQGRAEADQTNAEAEAIWAEVEANPARWQT